MPQATDVERYDFRLECHLAEGESLFEQRLEPTDFERAILDTSFAALRAGRIDEYAPNVAAAVVEPTFGSTGDSRASGFRVGVPVGPDDTFHRSYDLDYFCPRATRWRQRMVRDERIETDAEFRYRLDAFLDEPTDEADGFDVEQSPLRFPVTPGRVADLGPFETWDEPSDDDVPAYVPRSVIEDLLDEARANPEVEVGGFLVGHLRRDTDTRTVYVEVTELVSVLDRGTADRTSFTFTPESFDHVRETIALRDRGEMLVGWAHSHPFSFCAECPLPTPPECIAKVLFFSVDDDEVMETTFPHPFALGLLAGTEPKLEAAVGHAPVRLFGWRNGCVVPRGLYVLSEE